MIRKRLIEALGESKRYIAWHVAAQWCALVANIVMMLSIAVLLEGLYLGSGSGALVLPVLLIAAALVVRYLCARLAARMSYLSAREVKRTLRAQLFSKLLRLGASYNQQVQTSEVVQLAVEGVDQLETYFGAYLPQLFYSMLAPVTLFAVLAFVDLPSALVLLVCVPLIPVAIAAVQTWAKKLLGRYWGQYTALGDSFLENLQGLTTLKIYQSDGYRHQVMNEEAEKFRKVTMRVLTMQLNSISVMDLVAYGGAALGMGLAVSRLGAGQVGLAGCLAIILLSADFFLPMRQLGSFFHIAMNGMAASDKLFRLLDLPEEGRRGTQPVPDDCGMVCTGLRFSYQPEREVLHGLDLTFPKGSFTALVGESGCGKSTLAAILAGRRKDYTGSVTVGGVELTDLDEDSLMANLTYVGHDSYLFKGTVGDNLRMAAPTAGDDALWAVLERAKLADFLRGEQGLDTPLLERGSNLSGGQRQRLALARALLHDSPVYLFDEATSNIDVESENDIMEQIHDLARTKTVILISHRLANVTAAHRIYLMEGGRVTQRGTHTQLLAAGGGYARLWEAQQELEHYGKEGQPA